MTHPSVTTIKRIRSDSMAVSALTHIIIDLSSRDVKRRSVMDIPETRDEVFGKILSYKSILQGIKAGKVQIVLF
jgi:protein CMS1